MRIEGFSVNDATIDAQHKELFDLIEHTLQAADEDVPEETLEETLAFLARYVECHLTHEEAYMRAHGYPHLDQHVVWHGKFTETFGELESRYQAGHDRKALYSDIRLFVRNWWFKHILVEDKRYDEYINGYPESHPPDESPDYHATAHDVC